MNTASHTHDIAVLGCGLMGSALVRAFATAGYRVAAWNRTPERAAGLAGDGVTAVRSVDDAVASAPLVVACMSDYETTLAALEPAREWTGRTLINLASAAPEEVQLQADWATGRGADYLDGSIVCFPEDIGTPAGSVLYSGSAAAWSTYEQVLMTLGASTAYVSDRVTDSSVLNVGVVGAFYVSALSAYVEAASYVLDHGVAPDLLDAATRLTVDRMLSSTRAASAAISSGRHESDQATIDTYLEASDAALAVMQASGRRAPLLAAAVDQLRTASDNGLGPLGFSAQSTSIGTGTTPGGPR